MEYQITVLDIPLNTVNYVKIYKCNHLEGSSLATFLKKQDSALPSCLSI